MRFESVKVENFLSYKSQVFADLDRPGLTLIEGRNLDEGDSNGAGKSALWDAISWAIFGKTVRGVEADAVIHRKYKKNCCVEVDIEHAGKMVKIRRAREHEKWGNRLIFGLHDEDESREKGTVALTEAALHQYLGIDFELFRCTILFAQGETFNFVDATDKAQKEILSKVMRLDIAAYAERVKADIKNAENEKVGYERELAVLESHVVENPEEMFRADSDEWNAKKSSKISEIQSEIAAKSKELAGIEGQVTSLATMSVDRSKLREVQDKIREKIQDIVNRKSVLESKISDLDIQAKKFKSLGDVCPTCLRPGCAKLSASKYTEICKERDACRSEINGLAAETNPWKKKSSLIGEKIDALDDKLMDSRAYEAQRDSLTDRIAELKLELVELKKETNPFEDKIEEEIEKQEKIKSTINKTKSLLKAISDRMPYMQFWLIAFSDAGIKSFVFDLVCSTLTNRANRYLGVMTGGSISISFDTQKKLKSGEFREKFDCVINSGSEQVAYKSYSGGEKRRVSLAVDMALSDLMSDHYAAGFNLVVFDEQTNFLDKSGRSNFMKLLRGMAKAKRVFVVDHASEFKSMFDDVICVEKKNGVSRVV